MKKVVLIMPNLTFGGIQTQVVYLAKELQKIGYETLILGVGKVREEFTDYLTANRLPFDLFTDFKSPRSKPLYLIHSMKIALRLRKYKPDYILSYHKNVALKTNLFWQLSGAKKSFFMERGGIAVYASSRLTIEKRFAIRNASCFVTNSRHAEADIQKLFRGKRINTRAIVNSVSVKQVLAPEDNFSKKILDLLVGQKTYLMVANFFKGKRHDLLLQAWEQSEAKKRGWLVLVGQSLSNSIEKRVDNEAKVIYLAQSTHVPFWISRSDVCILASDSEGCPNVVLEYLINKKFFIGSDVPGIAEIIPEYYHKKILFQNTLADCVLKLNEADANTDNSAAIEACYNRICSEYTVERMLNSYQDLLGN